MKKYFNISWPLMAAFLLVVSSCNWVDPDINLDPNNPTAVNMADLLPQVQASTAYLKGGDLARYTAIPMQHFSGVTRQSFAFERYLITESDINNLWNSSYTIMLKNAEILLGLANDAEARYYAGAAKTMTAYKLGIMSAAWGDMPYSNALEGDERNFTPSYDSQEAIYNTVNALLTSAIEDFNSDGGPVKPAADDLVYQGNAENWASAAASLRARFALHLSKRNGYAAVLTALNSPVISSNAQNFKFNFGPNVNERNPIYQFDEQRTDIRVSSTIVDKMNATDDPRRSAYFTMVNDADENPAFIGSDTGSGNESASMVGPHYASTNSPVYFMTHAEVKFIEAEAKFATGDAAGAAAAYNDGVKASLAQHGASNEDWEAVHANADASSITWEKIMEAKYIALFTDSEVWTDWRRTGFPVLSVAPNPSTPDNEIPRRFLYPLNERLYNGANVPSGVTQANRVWWDN